LESIEVVVLKTHLKPQTIRIIKRIENTWYYMNLYFLF